MMVRKLFGAAAVASFLAGSAFAQAPQPTAPTAPARPAPAQTTPAPAATPAARPAVAPTAAPAAQAQKVNLNTAPVTQLDKLPQIGEARAKAIVEARGKTKFKDWNDFVARKVVPSNAEEAIKDKVTF